MKVGKVRNGEKFVLDDRGGVWERVGDGEHGVKARCYFGPRDVYGVEIEVDPNAYCYVIFEDRPKPFGREAAQAGVARSVIGDIAGTKIRIVTEDTAELIVEIIDPTQGQILSMSAAETLRLVPPGKRNKRIYHVSEFAYDLDENVFYLLVMSERVGGKDEDE